MSTIHPRAFAAAVATECAARVGRFWELYERLFRRQWQLDSSELMMHATAVGLDPKYFQECMTSSDPARKVTEHKEMAARLGITSTPTFLIGRLRGLRADLEVEIRGAQDYDVFAEVLRSMGTPK